MEIRFLTIDDSERLMDLWSQSFLTSRENIKYWANEENIKNYIGAFEKGELVSVVGILPFEFYLRGQIFPLAGIGGVATFPEHRGKNYVHHLLSESLKISREKGLIYSMLYPFSFEYYRTFGWEMAGFQRRYIRKLVSIPKFKEMDYVKRGDWESLKIFEEIYEKYAKNFTGMLKRNPQRWERLFSSQNPFTYYYVWEKYNKPQGYLIYTVDTSQRKIFVKEMVCLNSEAYRGFLGLFARQSMNIEEAQWTSPLEDSLHFILPNPRGDCYIEPTFMLRIVDLEKAVKKLNFPKDLEGKINIEVRDEYTKENDGIWEIEIKDGKASIEKGDKKDISIGINILSQIFAGVLTPKKAYEYGLIEVEDEKKLEFMEKAFPYFPTFSLDYF